MKKNYCCTRCLDTGLILIKLREPAGSWFDICPEPKCIEKQHVDSKKTFRWWDVNAYKAIYDEFNKTP